jgi:hypothetical protein
MAVMSATMRAFKELFVMGARTGSGSGDPFMAFQSRCGTLSNEQLLAKSMTDLTLILGSIGVVILGRQCPALAGCALRMTQPAAAAGSLSPCACKLLALESRLI